MRLCFISTGGAIRGVIAEAIAKKMSKEVLINMEILSAGVEPLQEVPKQVIDVLEEKGYSVEEIKPRSLKDVFYEDADIIITLSTEARDKSPYMHAHKRREHWVLEEIKDVSDLQALRKLRDQIEENVVSLFKIR